MLGRCGNSMNAAMVGIVLLWSMLSEVVGNDDGPQPSSSSFSRPATLANSGNEPVAKRARQTFSPWPTARPWPRAETERRGPSLSSCHLADLGCLRGLWTSANACAEGACVARVLAFAGASSRDERAGLARACARLMCGHDVWARCVDATHGRGARGQPRS
eukprot:5581774-Alexandrium_andersonii.AAC.1